MHSPECLIVVVVGWGYTCHHECLGVASKGGLEQPGQLGVTVRDMLRLSVHQSRDDVTKSRERQIDLCSFLQALT